MAEVRPEPNEDSVDCPSGSHQKRPAPKDPYDNGFLSAPRSTLCPTSKNKGTPPSNAKANGEGSSNKYSRRLKRQRCAALASMFPSMSLIASFVLSSSASIASSLPYTSYKLAR
ncbi:hypothetical protein F5Y00DRAFT_266065 [Daldinia vernicosa]|uniref:uncharacterized protein n=1 Tax=Daldinia vernicosa TaxID=114800 RepID=UPI0020081822|nr:uncharacterized protein F5Y00DRAFT_266065 [Daldinia vernicosa]KAI0844972.1 hypothetical protein F5Y00DRAFT_266065 [Daldinia vernicosa]